MRRFSTAQGSAFSQVADATRRIAREAILLGTKFHGMVCAGCAGMTGSMEEERDDVAETT